MPQSIIFYRDGVSEGEYDTVRAGELKAINDAIDRIWTQAKAKVPKPLITFIVVGKRYD
jgi:eukaryotic translation initiation factor 2C